MEDVVEKELMKRRIDEKVLKCYYNICRYYNKDVKIVDKYLQQNWRNLSELYLYFNYF